MNSAARTYDLKAPFQRKRYPDLFQEANGCEFDDEPAVRARAKELGLNHENDHFWGLLDDVFDATVEKDLAGPIFVTDYPLPISPLAKKSPDDPRLTERFEIFIAGMELGNAFTELNDPIDQEARFAEQVASKDPEAPGEVDIDYVPSARIWHAPHRWLGYWPRPPGHGLDRSGFHSRRAGSSPPCVARMACLSKRRPKRRAPRANACIAPS